MSGRLPYHPRRRPTFSQESAPPWISVSYTSGLLTGLREGVEAALIVSIVLAYLARTGQRQHFGQIWLGTGAAIVVSALLGVILFTTVGGFEEPYEQAFEASRCSWPPAS